MRRVLFGVAIGVGAVLGMFVGSVIVSAQTETPEGVQVFQIDTGQTCVLWPDGSGECYCPCVTGLCPEATDAPQETPEASSTPITTSTPGATATPSAAPTETPGATDDHEKCNRGGGNGSEGCDPGNSGGNPGNAGEGHDG